MVGGVAHWPVEASNQAMEGMKSFGVKPDFTLHLRHQVQPYKLSLFLSLATQEQRLPNTSNEHIIFQ